MTSTTRRALPAVLLTAVVLAVAFAGGATAAKLITGKQIKNNTVSTQDIKNKTVKSKDVKDGNLAEADLNGAVKSKLNAPSVKGYEVRSVTVEVGPGGQDTLFIKCSPGKLAISGGGSWETTDFGAVIQESSPTKVIGDFFAPADPTFADSWKVSGEHNGFNPADLTAYVICVNPN